jgi:hypothetical protein
LQTLTGAQPSSFNCVSSFVHVVSVLLLLLVLVLALVELEDTVRLLSLLGPRRFRLEKLLLLKKKASLLSSFLLQNMWWSG